MYIYGAHNFMFLQFDTKQWYCRIKLLCLIRNSQCQVKFKSYFNPNFRLLFHQVQTHLHTDTWNKTLHLTTTPRVQPNFLALNRLIHEMLH